MNKKVVVIVLVSILLQLVVIMPPLVEFLHLCFSSSCETKIKILKRLPMVYNMYLLAGVLDSASLVAICFYMIYELRRQEKFKEQQEYEACNQYRQNTFATYS
jgi:uncharacterized membrane protein